MAGEKLLIIDDHEQAQILLKSIFEREGYEVYMASTSSMALDKAKEVHPNLIILDIMLPDMDGYQLLEFIKQEPDLSLIPVIILSAKRELEDRLRGLRLGVMDFLTKPFHREELTARVRNVLDFFAIRLQSNQVDGSKPFGRLLKHLENNSISKLIPVVRKEAKLGYEYPEAAKVLAPDEIGGEAFTLERMAKEKYLDRVFYDVIHICPACSHHDLNFREICPQCESAEIMSFNMIIHIKCGHKGMEYEFNQSGQWICPVCNRTLEGEGIDYEKSNRPVYQCLTCRKKFSDPVVNFRCMNCDRLFVAGEAIKRKIYAYHYHKFDEDLAEDLLILRSQLGRAPIVSGANGADQNKKKALSRFFQVFEEVGLNLVDWDFIPEQLHLEIKRCRKKKFNVSLMKVTILKEDGLEFESVNELPQAALRKIALVMKKCLRELDVISIRHPFEFGILLIETPLRMAKILGRGIQDYLNQLKVPAIAEIAIAAYPEDGTEADQLLEVINLNLAILKPDDSQEDYTLT